MADTPSLISLRDRREQMEAHIAIQRLASVSMPASEVLALVVAVEAAQEAWTWINAVARSAESHASRHGATVARQNLSIALTPFEEPDDV